MTLILLALWETDISIGPMGFMDFTCNMLDDIVCHTKSSVRYKTQRLLRSI